MSPRWQATAERRTQLSRNWSTSARNWAHAGSAGRMRWFRLSSGTNRVFGMSEARRWACSWRDAELVPCVQEQGGCLDAGRALGHVDHGPRLEHLRRVLGRRRAPEQFGEGLPQVRRSVGDERRGEEAPEGRVLPTPAEAHDLELERGFPTLFVGDGPAQAPLGVGAEQDQMADPLRMTGRVGDRHRAALGHTEQREPLQAEVVDDGFEVLHEGVEREVVDVVRRQPAAPLVVADELAPPGEADEPVAPDRALPVVVEMGDPVRPARVVDLCRRWRRRSVCRRSPCRSECPDGGRAGRPGAAVRRRRAPPRPGR